MPLCYNNRTSIIAYATANCTGAQTSLFALNIVPRFNTCVRSTDDNRTFWMTTCPQVLSDAAAVLSTAVGLLCVFVLAVSL